jgi:hypothetical protein
MTNINKSKVCIWPVIFTLQETSSSLLAVHGKVMMVVIKRRRYHYLNNSGKITNASSEDNRHSAGVSVPSVNNSLYITVTPVRLIFLCSRKPAVKKEMAYLSSKQEARSVNENIHACLAAERYSETICIHAISSIKDTI